MTGRAEVSRLKGRLDATFKRAPPPSAEVELQSDFARYLCVLVSGFLENAITALILDFAERRSSTEIASFVEDRLDYWTSPNTEKICSLLGSFSADWRAKSERFLVDERKAGVNSLVALRHKIAHGESVGTSLSQVREYYLTAQKVVDFIIELTE
jgi:hypothetical protein